MYEKDEKCRKCKNNGTAICNRCDAFYDEFDPIDMSELKPCPFCGGEAETVCTSTVNERETLSKIFVIRCKKCDIRSARPFRIFAEIKNDGSCVFDNSEKEKAIEAWNRRANDV